MRSTVTKFVSDVLDYIDSNNSLRLTSDKNNDSTQSNRREQEERGDKLDARQIVGSSSS